MTSNAPFMLDRTVVIGATTETVFRYFTDSKRWASWWGPGSSVEAKVGGKVYVRHRDGTESGGVVVEIASGKRFVFTYGFNSGKPIPIGASRVTITLESVRAGTRLTLQHELNDEAVRNEHVQGWRFQLSLFSNVVSDEVNANVDAIADAWYDAWADPDAAHREVTLRRIASEGVRFQNRFSNLDGLADLIPHISAAQKFMPGTRLLRNGPVRHCQGMALSDWITEGADGKEQGRGTSTFVLGPTGLIEWVTSCPNPPASDKA